LGKLKQVRYLKITGQPEFDESGFSLAVVGLYGRMCETAREEGKGVVVEGPRVRSGEFVFEALIGEVDVSFKGKELQFERAAEVGSGFYELLFFR
jgi:hypothetical protein